MTAVLAPPRQPQPQGPTPPGKRNGRELVGKLGKRLLQIFLILVLLWLFVAPLVTLFLSSLEHRDPAETGWTLGNFSDVLRDGATWRALGASFTYAVGVTVGSMIYATWFCLLTTQFRFRLRKIITPVMFLISLTPTVYYALAWTSVANGASGLLNRAFQAVGLDAIAASLTVQNWVGLIAVTVLKAGALAYLMMIGPMYSTDQSILEASRIGGSSKWKGLVTAVLPALKPVLVANAIFVFVRGMEAFDAPAVIGLPAGIRVFSTHIFGYTQTPISANYGAASAGGLLLVAIVIVLVYIQQRAVSGSFVTVGARSRVRTLGETPSYGWLLSLSVVVLTVVSFLLPVAQLVIGSFQPYFGAYSSPTLRHYIAVFENADTSAALQNTLTIGVFAGLLSVILAFCTTYLYIRFRGPATAGLQMLSWVPVAMPGIVLGLALLWAYTRVPGFSMVYGTVWLLVIALATAGVPQAARAAEGAVEQIGEELEESARVGGASRLRAVVQVTLPLIIRSLFAAWAVVAITVTGILDIPLILGGGHVNTIPTTAYVLYTNGNIAAASALFVVWIALVVSLVTIGWVLSKLLTAWVTRSRGRIINENAVN